MDGGEVASGMKCVVISGARLMPDKSLARVLASLVRLGLARCWEATPVVVSGNDFKSPSRLVEHRDRPGD
jgi:hypothetical protein